MAAPGIPTNFIVQQGNAQVLLSWDLMAGATSYKVYRSTNGTSFSLLTSPATNSYLDTAVTVGTQYFYKVSSDNGTESSTTSAQSIVPTRSGQMTLGQLRLLSQQKADMVNNPFVTVPEWNTYINQSAFELYDLLTTLYEDYYVTAPVSFATDGSSSQYALTTVAPDFYKLVGVDMGLGAQGNAWVTLKKFDFVSRNRYIYPQLGTSVLGLFNPSYRLVGSTIMFIPVPAAGQYMRIWYIPRMTQLLQDTDILDGVNGWDEYVAVDVAIKALLKEESDAAPLMAVKQQLLDRIEASAMNRDAGMPDTISDTRSWSNRMGGYGWPGGDGPAGGY